MPETKDKPGAFSIGMLTAADLALEMGFTEEHFIKFAHRAFELRQETRFKQWKESQDCNRANPSAQS